MTWLEGPLLPTEATKQASTMFCPHQGWNREPSVSQPRPPTDCAIITNCVDLYINSTILCFMFVLISLILIRWQSCDFKRTWLLQIDGHFSMPKVTLNTISQFQSLITCPITTLSLTIFYIFIILFHIPCNYYILMLDTEPSSVYWNTSLINAQVYLIFCYYWGCSHCYKLQLCAEWQWPPLFPLSLTRWFDQWGL